MFTLPCDGKVRLQAEGHVYSMLVGEASWESTHLISVTQWIKRWVGEDDRKYEFMARAQVKSINQRFLLNQSYLPEYYDRFSKEDWDRMRNCCYKRSTVAKEFGPRLGELVRVPPGPEFAQKHRRWMEAETKTPEVFTQIFGANETQVIPLPPHLTPVDLRRLWPQFGTRLHKDIELFLNKEELTQGTEHTEEFQQFKSFHLYHLRMRNQEVLRTELTMCVPELYLCGQIDCLARKPNGKLVIYDWKRTAVLAKKLTGPEMPEPWDHRPHTRLDEYTIQINIYAHMLRLLGVTDVDELALVCFHRELREYFLVNIPLFVPGSLDAFALEWMINKRKDELKST